MWWARACCTSAGKDHIAKAWLAAEGKSKGKASGSPAQTAAFRGHTDGVAGVAANQQLVCTASWDTTLRLWPASEPCSATLHVLARLVKPVHREQRLRASARLPAPLAPLALCMCVARLQSRSTGLSSLPQRCRQLSSSTQHSSVRGEA